MQATVQQGSWQKQWGRLVAKSWSDLSLKERLLADPTGVMREHGIEVPYGAKVKVVEDTEQVRHLVLPCSPSGELTDEELAGSVGYDSFSGFSFNCGGGGGCGGSGGCGCGCDSNA